MNTTIFKCTISAIALICAQSAYAQSLPAVSGVNGRLELEGGLMTLPNSGKGSVAGSLSMPLGDRFGAQFDAALNTSVTTSGGGALHLFTRDPSSYLVGVTAGFVRSNVGTIGALGAEGELYFDNFSLEAWAGVAGLDYDAAAAVDKSGVFAIVDLAYYATDDLRFEIGASSILNYKAVHIGAEYQINALETPFSLTSKVQLGEDGAVSAKAGIRFYFGGKGNSLIDRHRQDDPSNRPLDLFGGAGGQLTDDGVVTPPPVVVVAPPE